MTALNSADLIHCQLLHISLVSMHPKGLAESIRALQSKRPGLTFACFEFLNHTKFMGQSFNLFNLSFLICEIPSSQAYSKTPKSPGQVARWLEHRPIYQKTAGSIPSQGMC